MKKKAVQSIEYWFDLKILDRTLVPLLILFFIPAMLYYNSISYSYSGDDDIQIIRDNIEYLKNPSNVFDAFKKDAYLKANSSFLYRPLQTISYIFDMQLSNRTADLSSFHTTSICIHILTCFFMYLILIQLGVKKFFALFFAAIYSVHPMFTQAVVWLPGRGDVLSGLFTATALFTYLKYEKSRRAVYLLGHILSYAAALLSKETTILIPLVIISYNIFILKESFFKKKNLFIITLWIIVIPLYYWLRSWGLGNVMDLRHTHWLIGFIKNIPVIPITFGKYFLPHDMNPYPLFKYYSIVLGVVLIIGYTFLLYYNKEIRGICYFGLSIFLLFTLPPMILRVTNAETVLEYFEHRTYLPLIGLTIFSAGVVNYFYDRIHKYALWGVLSIFFIGFTVLAYMHEYDYKDRISFYTSAISSCEKNGFAHFQRGIVYAEIGNYQASLNDYSQALDYGFITFETYYSKGVAHFYLNSLGEAVENFTMALYFDNASVMAHGARGMTYVKLGLYNSAGQDFLWLIHHNAELPKAYSQLAETYELMHDYQNALEAYRMAQKSGNNDPGVQMKINELQKRLSGNGDHH